MIAAAASRRRRERPLPEELPSPVAPRSLGVLPAPAGRSCSGSAFTTLLLRIPGLVKPRLGIGGCAGCSQGLLGCSHGRTWDCAISGFDYTALDRTNSTAGILGFRHKEKGRAHARSSRLRAAFRQSLFVASPPSHRRFETSGSILNPARQGFARKQRGDLSPRDGLRAASEASDSLCRNPRPEYDII